MKRVLLSTPTTPYPIQPWHDSPTDIMRQRFFKGQGIFTVEGHMHLIGSFIIAQNISAPCVVLDHPTIENWIEEIKKGYDYVGISSLTPNIESVVDMFQAVRRYSPKTETILGSFAAQSFGAFYPEEERSKLVDHVVLGDGVRWFRELLGDDCNAPVRQHFLPRCSFGSVPWLDRHPPGDTAPLIAAVGCDRGCDFCTTTTHFGGKRHVLVTPEQVKEEIKMWQKRMPGTDHIIYEEDQDKEFVNEVGRLLREDPEIDFSQFMITILISINTLSTFDDLDELAHNNISSMFIGLESKFAPDQGYGKRIGDAREIVHGLYRRGMATITGWMAGFDFHTRATLEEDFQYFLACEPTAAQLTRVTPYPGTPLYNRLKEEGRVQPFKWEDVSFYGGGMMHKNLYEHEIMEFIREGDERLLHTWGPTLLRFFKLSFNGYERYKEYDDPHFRQIAERHRQRAFESYALIPALERFAPNGRVRKMVKELEQRWKQHFGEPSSFMQVQARYGEIKAAVATLKETVDPTNRHIRIPPAKRYHYFGKDIKDDGSLPYRKEYLNEDPDYIRTTKIQAADQSLLGVAHAVAQVLEYPESKLHAAVEELRIDASSLLKTLAGQIREPKLDASLFLATLGKGVTQLLSKAIEAGENPENEIDFSVQTAKSNLAELLEYYAGEIEGGSGLKKVLTHPALRSIARTTLKAVGVEE
jgi:haloalkane dehalogenase